eukprot:2661024-Pleurochrysis_carterae.AAC.5
MQSVPSTAQSHPATDMITNNNETPHRSLVRRRHVCRRNMLSKFGEHGRSQSASTFHSGLTGLTRPSQSGTGCSGGVWGIHFSAPPKTPLLAAVSAPRSACSSSLARAASPPPVRGTSTCIDDDDDCALLF